MRPEAHERSAEESAGATVAEASGAPRPAIGLWDAVSLIVGVVIGAGIYETAPLVFSSVSSSGAALGCWALGGVLSLAGACCYAELASTYPRAGGDYVYLSRAFGSWVGFLFGWSQLAVILTASIGMMAYVFADYAAAIFPASGDSRALLAAGAVLVLTLANVASVDLGKRSQNLLSIAKVAGLGAIVVAALWTGDVSRAVSATPRASGGETSFGLAMILVLYTYGGWNDAAFVAAEVRDKRRNVARALLIGTGLVLLVYLLVNAAFLASLGFEAAQRSRAIAADAVEAWLGPAGRAAISVLVMISALGAANAIIFTGSRLHASVGADYGALAALGRWNTGRGSPVWALAIQGAIALVLIALVGTASGRALAEHAFAAVGMAGTAWAGHGGFDTLLRATAPVFWLFFLLTGLSLFVLRFKDPRIERPFRVPAYPVVPLVFCATCAWMLVSSLDYAGRLVLLSLPFLLLGLPFYFTRRRLPVRAMTTAPRTAH